MRLEPSDALAVVLFQITGPAHVPLKDPRWQELFLGHGVWVHVEYSSSDATAVMTQACQSMVTHAPRSSNLAALVIHVTHMLRDLSPSGATNKSTATSVQQSKQFSQRIARVAQAQRAAGALNWLRLLAHAVLTHASAHISEYDVAQCFVYTSREDDQAPKDTSADLLAALLDFLFAWQYEQEQQTANATTGNASSSTFPELYDATVLALQLLLVLFSPQLYQPMQSSFQLQTQLASSSNGKSKRQIDKATTIPVNLFWDLFFRPSSVVAKRAASLMALLFTWYMERPAAPPSSVAHHNITLAKSVAQAKGEKPGPDGLHESYLIVDAAREASLTSTSTNDGANSSHALTSTTRPTREGSHRSLLDATKGVLVFSSNIILLPFRLVSLALHLWGHKEKGYDTVHKQHLQSSLAQQSRTKDVLWLSDSPLADLARCLLLLAANNNRVGENPFRVILASLADNRWDAVGNELPDLPNFDIAATMGELSGEEMSPLVSVPLDETNGNNNDAVKKVAETMGNSLLINFEALFEAFGRTVHTELGAFLLYTLMQTSPTFAESIAVRSDLDTLVLPLLRTLYFASSVRHFAAQDFSSRQRPSAEAINKVSIRNCPFRSVSQLYLIIILLLLFSQDPSFGPDAFKRVMIPSIPFYKERHLKDISLRSVLILYILRCLTFNLHRLGDPFLLSNCCAILMNLSPSMTELYDYAAMRLASITFSSMKKYAALRRENPNLDEDVEYTSPTAMYGEVSRTLLRVLKQCVSSKNISGNLRLVYSLVYHQSDFLKVVSAKDCPFAKQEYSRVQKAIQLAATLIEKADARTATKALMVLDEQVDNLWSAVADNRKKDQDDFTFTYEEEADPEVFFVPYLWEVIVCTVTASSIEWQKNEIQVFPLLDVEEVDLLEASSEVAPPSLQVFSQDVSDVV